MADRTVTLQIKVDDKEVDQANASLQRLKISAQAVQTPNLGGKAPGESEEQQKRLSAWLSREMPAASKEATTAIEGVTAASGEMTQGFAAAGVSGAALGGVAVVLTLALVAMVAVIVGAVDAVFKITKAFADYGNQIEQDMRTTGLAAATVAALRHEADRTGVSFETIAGSVNTFREVVGKAAAGNTEASATLKALGIDTKQAFGDIDTAFSQAFAAIAKMPAGLEQARLAQKAFGDQWSLFLEVVRDSNGDMDVAKKRFEELSGSMAGKDAAAAREFTKAWADLQLAVKGVENAFGREFLNTVNSALTSFTNWIVSNKETIHDWAVFAGNAIAGILQWLKDLVNYIDAHPTLGLILKGLVVGTAPGMALAAAANQGAQQQSPFMPPTTAPTGGPDPEAVNAFIEAQKAEFERRRRAAAADADAAITLLEQQRSQLSKYAKDFFDESRKMFEQHGDEGFFKKQVDDMLASTKSGMDAIEAKLKEFHAAKDKLADADAIHQQVTAQAQAIHEKDDADERVDIQQKMQDAIAKYREQKQKEADRDEKQRLAEEKRGIEQHLAEMRVAAEREYQIHDEPRNRQVLLAQHAVDMGKKTEAEALKFLQDQRKAAAQERIDELDKEIKEVDDAIKKRPDLKGYFARFRADLSGRRELAQAQEDTLGTEGLQPLTQEEKLREHINKLLSDDVKIIKERRDLLKTSEEDQLVTSIKQLEDTIANGGANDGLKVYEAHLRDVVEYRNRELEAVIAIQHAQFELSHALEISNQQVRAGIYQHMAQQKTLQQGVVDGWNETYDAINKVVNGPLEKLNQKTKGFLAFIIRPLEAMQTQALNSIWGGIVDKVFGADNPIAKGLKSTGNPMLDEAKEQTSLLKQIRDAVGGNPAGINPTTGGGIGSIFGGLFGGRRMGPGGTPYFNPTSGGGNSQYNDPTGVGRMLGEDDEEGGMGGGGGLFGNFRNIFKPMKNPITGKENSALAGKLGGIGSIASLIGGFVPGRGGRVLQYAGMGMQIGSMFGPWGAAIGAGAGALFGLFGHRDNAEKQLRSAIQAAYGINVTDKSVLSAIRQIGESYFGKGQVGRNATAVVQLDEARELIMNYAQSTGQHSSKLDNMYHTDPLWSGNQFGSAFSGFGASSMAAGGMSVNRTIMPARPVVSQSSGGDMLTLMASHAEALHRIADQLERFETVPASHVLMKGVEDPRAASAIADSQADHYGNDWSRREKTAINSQY